MTDIVLAGSTRVIRSVVRQELGRFCLSVGECSHMEELYDLLRRGLPKAILIQADVLGPELGTTLTELRRRAPRGQCPILVFSTTPELSGPLLEAGADGFLEFPFACDVLKSYTKLFYHGPRRILIVDDTKIIHATLQEALREEPYELFHAYNGREAQAILAQQDVDLVLTDVEMPEMNGYELCHWIKQDPRYSSIPVYMSSTLHGSAEIDRGFDAGADEYLVKPVDPDDLRSALRYALGSQLRHQRESILIVDHLDQVAQLVANALDNQGFRVTVLKSVDQALASADILQPALLILGEENASAAGRELIRHFKSRPELSRMPCLMITERESQLEKRKARQAGVDAFVTKPFSSDKILALVERLLAESKLSRERDALKTENHLIQDQLIQLNATLAQKVEEKTRAIRALLDNTSIGLLMMGRDFRILPDYSTHLEDILEEKDLAGKDLDEVLFSRTELGDYERSRSRMVAEWSITDDVMIFEANNPACIREAWGTFGGKKKFLEIDWSAVLAKDGKTVDRILISVRDATESMHLQQAADQARQQVQQLLEVLSAGVDAYFAFAARARQSLADLQQRELSWRESREDPELARRLYIGLHSMKGEARFLKLNSLTEVLHRAEAFVQAERSAELAQDASLAAALAAVVHVMDQYQEALQPLLAQSFARPQGEKRENSNDLRQIFLGFSTLAENLAKDLGKGGCRLVTDLPEPYLLSEPLAGIFHESLVHLIRNSIDHGLETPEERQRKGKPQHGTITLSLRGPGSIVFCDDGQGLSLDRLAKKGKEIGKKWTSEAELAELIFDPGFSTKESVDQISGRGVGMDAVRLRLADGKATIQIEPQERQEGFLKFAFLITWSPSFLRT